MEKKMRESAKSTSDSTRKSTQVLSRVFLVGILVSFPCSFSATAQEGAVGLQTTPTIASTETTRNISEAATPIVKVADPAETGIPAPPELVPAPQVITKTYLATAYCLKGQTASGISVRRGIIAADPRILPLGSVVRLQAGAYSGIYTVMDTGGAIRGQRIDIYFPSRAEAIRFGARKVKLEVLRHGWDPTDDEVASE